MFERTGWVIVENSNGSVYHGISGTSSKDVREKYFEKFGVKFVPGNGLSVVNYDLSHFVKASYHGRAKYDWPKHDAVLMLCRSYQEYFDSMIEMGITPARKSTVQVRRSTFRTAGFKVSSWRRW